jgi:2-polyprenyl-3-methyl-5-hydroxy-6-metoxy-1,4-benzoquinol methylase
MEKIVRDRCKYVAKLVENKTVLDIGCVDHNLANRSKGHWLHEHLVNSAKKAIGIDYEESEIKKMQNEGYHVLPADATNFELNSKFDCIVAGEIIEHLSNPGLFLERARAHLLENGQLILTTPNANCIAYFIENLFLGREIENSDHVNIYTPKTITKLLERNGFKPKRILFVVENTAFFHTNRLIKMLVSLKYLLEIVCCIFQPSLSRQMLIIAQLH